MTTAVIIILCNPQHQEHLFGNFEDITHVQCTQTDTVCQTIHTDCTDCRRISRSVDKLLIICTSTHTLIQSVKRSVQTVKTVNRSLIICPSVGAGESLMICADCTDRQRISQSVYMQTVNCILQAKHTYA